MIRARAIAGLVILAICSAAQAEELRLSADEIDNLGISFVPLSAATEAAGIEATARVVLPPAGDVVISALQSGLLTRLAANVGDEVVEGQVLAELKSPEFISLQREFLDALNAQRLAQVEYERDAELEEEGIISTRRLQETTMRKAVADATLDEHRQLLRFAGMRDADIGSLESRQRLQGSLRIRAPFNGVIAERLASNGERLDAMSPIYRLVDMSELWLDIDVPQEQLALVRPGARVTATGSSGAQTAEVTTVGRAIDPRSQSAVVRARLDAGAAGLGPGQVVAVRILASDADGVTPVIHEVPAAAVTRSGTSSYVFVRSAAGVDVRMVEVLGVNSGRAYVSGNLDENDTVAASGISALKSLWAASADEES
jgi:cobalt-zinc-cadmium efflux system membrane fusion protein